MVRCHPDRFPKEEKAAAEALAKKKNDIKDRVVDNVAHGKMLASWLSDLVNRQAEGEDLTRAVDTVELGPVELDPVEQPRKRCCWGLCTIC